MTRNERAIFAKAASLGVMKLDSQKSLLKSMERSLLVLQRSIFKSLNFIATFKQAARTPLIEMYVTCLQKHPEQMSLNKLNGSGGRAARPESD